MTPRGINIQNHVFINIRSDIRGTTINIKLSENDPITSPKLVIENIGVIFLPSLNDLTIGWQNLTSLSHPNATLVL